MRFLVGILFSFTFVSVTSAQAKLGLKVSPAISSNRILSDDDLYVLDTDGSAVRFKFGLEVDFPFGDNYAFGTGIFYVPKRFSITGAQISDGVNTTNIPFKETYKLQYINVPATIKLFTNEIQPDMKLYFQTGMLLDFKIFEDHLLDDDDFEIKNFKPIDLSFTFGSGIEFSVGVNTILYAGVSYDRGLINVIGKTENLPSDIIGKNDMVNLSVGVRF